MGPELLDHSPIRWLPPARCNPEQSLGVSRPASGRTFFHLRKGLNEHPQSSRASSHLSAKARHELWPASDIAFLGIFANLRKMADIATNVN